ncbi:MAG: metalloregulator ArsR/SmtB family transcription factor [Halopseudomonas yangmingensis]|uniref:ArsR family transcriptional regulator n=1 Tax=Halopseudomonas yangmingensis TaxID=1720063 RepID=A0A1I4QWG2_9GAMM|nr:metalloregulator ArsR/SmtB family transcription factor [Halopseudomonas yangmingensis]SFM44398.1 ArsR family transcriptional regulator [Halopseudomonas yangmingensis]
MGRKKRVLFLCVANSARSQMAEALLRHLDPQHFEAFSAGSAPAGVDSRARAALETLGISSAGLFSKSVEQLDDQPFDYVITLCDKSALECLVLPGAGQYIAWHFEDPAVSGSQDDFLKTLQQIQQRLRMFVLINAGATPPPAAVQQISPTEVFKCLADDTRARIALLVTLEQELCVCELTAALDQAQPKISRHLALLRGCGVLEDRRNGQWVYYRLHPQLPAWVGEMLRSTLGSNVQWLREDVQRLWHMRERPGRKPVCE